MKTAEQILDAILIEKHYYESKHEVKTQLACTMSIQNLKTLVDNFYKQTNLEKPKSVSEITVYGMIIYPSVFMSDEVFYIGQLIKIP